MKRLPDVLPALETAAREQFARFFREGFMAHSRAWVLERGDSAAVRYGPMTHDVANVYGYPLDVTRRQLVRALRKGTALADRRPGGNSRWWPVGMIETLRSAA